MSSPELTVVVPTHGVGLWVGELLSSILGDQEGVDLEVVVVDDASSDDTWEVVSAVAARDPRVRPYHATGAGGAQARNQGVELARGTYLAFADGDDVVPRGAYAAMLESLRTSGSDMAVGRFLKFWPSRVWRPADAWPAFDEARTGVTLAEQPSLVRNRACWNRVFRKDFWDAQGITFPSVPRSNDIVPMAKALTGAASIDVVRDHVYLYRARPGATSMTSKAASLAGLTSYLEQEEACARLIAAVGSPRLTAEYRSLFLRSDGWVHVRDYLKSDASLERQSLQRASTAVASILDLIGAHSAGFPGGQAQVWKHVAAGRWDAARRTLSARRRLTAVPVTLLRRVAAAQSPWAVRAYSGAYAALRRAQRFADRHPRLRWASRYLAVASSAAGRITSVG